MDADLLVVGGDVVTPHGVQRVDLALRDGVILAVGPEHSLPAGRERLNATGLIVLPGAVDVHMHYDRDGRLTDRVGIATGSAACGGVTSVVAFLLWEPDRQLGTTLTEAIAEVEAESYLDVGFHIYLHANDFDALQEIPALVERGVPSFKMAMAYKRRGMMCSDEFLVAAMATIAQAGGWAMVHAESGETIDFLEQLAQRDGHTRPVDYSATRPAYAEAEAVCRAATFGTASRCPVYVVHLTSRAALEQLLIAQAAGRDVQAETCPQYLVLSTDEMERQGPLAKIAPPLRSVDDQEALWQALATGELSVIASDHAPYPSSQKRLGIDNIFASPFGAPTVETMLPVAYSEGVHRRGLSLEWLSWVTSEGPARVTGLYPRKGCIQAQSDADLVLLDPTRRVTVSPDRLHSAADYTPFAGMQVQGWPVATIVGGEVLVRDGRLTREAGAARFLARPRLEGRLSDRLIAPQRAIQHAPKGVA